VVFVDDLFRLPMFEVTPPGAADMDAAFSAFVAFGRGSGHPAALNFGDDRGAGGVRRHGIQQFLQRLLTILRLQHATLRHAQPALDVGPRQQELRDLLLKVGDLILGSSLFGMGSNDLSLEA
jgi:hypothetical protein